MPWKVADVESHVKGLSDKQKNVWVRVANSALSRCEEADESDCEASAIKQANSVAKGMQEGGYVIEDDGGVTFGEPLQEATDQPSVIRRAIDLLTGALRREAHAESEIELRSDLVPLIESSVRDDGTMPIKIIAPGWGNSGYYSAELLERDGPEVYKRGLHMYLDHPTATEANERPERSLRDLVGTLASDGRWQENGADGPGIYADAQVVEGFRDALGELAPHLGLSHRALGDAEQGEAEGRSGPIVQSMVKAESVDFVTKAAAGGKVLELMESARGRLLKHEEDSHMDEKELKEAQGRAEAAEKERDELKEAQAKQTTELARLQEAAVTREAREVAAELLGKVEHLPELTRTRLVEALSKSPPTKDGALDRDAYEKAIEEAAKAEIKYLAELTKSGSITGMGEAGGGDDDKKKADEELGQTFQRLGLSESGARIAVAGRK